MAKLRQFACDPGKSGDGVWFDFEAGDLEPLPEPHATHLSVRVARLRNPKHRAELARWSEQLGAAIRRGENGKWDEAQTRALAAAVLVDWRNVEDDHGQPLPYSPDVAYTALANPANDPFRNYVIEASCRTDIYRLEAEEAAKGN